MRRLRDGLLVIAVGLALAGFWLVPLVVHLVGGAPMALPLAWADASLRGLVTAFASRPLLLVLVVLNLCAWVGVALGLRPPRPLLWLLALAPAMDAMLALDLFVAAPAEILWLPADRLMDGMLLALILGATASAAALARAGIARYGWAPPGRWPAAGSRLGSPRRCCSRPAAGRPRAHRVALAEGGRVADLRQRHPRLPVHRALGRARPRALRPGAVPALGGAALLRARVVARALPHERPHARDHGSRDHRRHLHPSVPRRRLLLHGAAARDPPPSARPSACSWSSATA